MRVIIWTLGLLFLEEIKQSVKLDSFGIFIILAIYVYAVLLDLMKER